MRTFITLAFLVGATPVFAGAIDGTYSTVSEADCDSELLLRIDGTGNHSTTCSPESSSGSYETERVNISWQIQTRPRRGLMAFASLSSMMRRFNGNSDRHADPSGLSRDSACAEGGVNGKAE